MHVARWKAEHSSNRYHALGRLVVTFLKLSDWIINNLQYCGLLLCLPGRFNAVNMPNQTELPMNSQEKQRRFEEDLIDSYDEELEMEVDDRILDGESALSTEAREQRKIYFRELFRLQGELVKLQDWVVASGHRLVVIFEGRDAAGKGGAIKRITQRLNPRVCRVAALPAPNNRERTQWYFQRYVSHLPAGGEMVLFDRSWYNRAGVERVMGFCTDEEYEEFFRSVPEFERMLVRSGIQIIKYWFSITDDEQELRFQARVQ